MDNDDDDDDDLKTSLGTRRCENCFDSNCNIVDTVDKKKGFPKLS